MCGSSPARLDIVVMAILGGSHYLDTKSDLGAGIGTVVSSLA
jgi:hypothetical protein